MMYLNWEIIMCFHASFFVIPIFTLTIILKVFYPCHAGVCAGSYLLLQSNFGMSILALKNELAS